ncbi:hypothetical protein N7489_003462 [Penicillium chrysogenum]|uniref:Uncharacterized protein n=1 Tax=Penicillium chrysogenum TaxID=5076 RepID=A0ABQ8W9Q1_PENCH|nr:uncharacterized protein N7489_003462 [Penicillium chrysogenum]KAJ5253052.1 hypothetical protein N7489_003462 [Penicillium chrysogenum]KAJ5253638.1 hypothetical protein N7524_010818 [Penicillium chrysogenum]KAJ5260281.1 hypothetical protein N7505_009662 [Penicillium chrysogenum]KAJ6141790.1 hypothetical protein N7497_010889 [Penicillium chrysogenum]
MVPRDNLDTTLQKRTDAIPSKRHVEHEEAHKGVFQFPFIQFSNLGFDRLPLVGGPTRKYERPTLHRRPIKSQSHLELELIKCNFRSLNILMGIRMALNESSFVNCLTEIAPVTAHSTVRIPLGFGAQDFEESPVRKCDKGSILPITTRGRGGGNNLQQLPPTIVTDGADGVPGLIKRSLLSRLFQAD